MRVTGATAGPGSGQVGGEGEVRETEAKAGAVMDAIGLERVGLERLERRRPGSLLARSLERLPGRGLLAVRGRAIEIHVARCGLTGAGQPPS